MHLFGRIIVIFFASLVASFVGALVVAIAALYPMMSDLVIDPAAETVFGTVVAFAALFVSFFAVLPWLLVVILGESFSIRSVIFYATAGGVVALLLYMDASDWNTKALTVKGFARRELEILAAAGIIAGFVYWAIAGRNADGWGSTPPGQTGGGPQTPP